MKVAVLGGGPSGLLASWAVVDAGHEPVVLERKPGKPDGTTAGVYYLHDACNLPLRSRDVEVLVSGGATVQERLDNYRRKVYGTDDVHVSLLPFNEVQVAFDGRQAMELCWDIVGPFVRQLPVMGWDREGMSVLALAEQYELVVNTIPLNVLLPERDWRHEKATIYRSTAPADESYMLYQANPAIPWYRASAIFGAFTLEYPGGGNAAVMREKGPRTGGQYVTVKKVLDSPDAMPEVPANVLLTGRYGAWSKKLLSHHSYEMTRARLGG